METKVEEKQNVKAIILASGTSMLPTMKDGAYYKVMEKKEIIRGDIVVYKYGDKYICHRVTKITVTKNGNVFYRTQGDNCEKSDPYVVRDKMIIGVVQL